MIRHTVNDIKMGTNAKINAIAVTYGYNAKEERKNASADCIINDPSELNKY